MEYIWINGLASFDGFIVEIPHLIYNFHIILFFEMELSETYDTKIEVRNHHYHSLRRMEPPAQLRNNVPKVEKDQLIRKI